MPKKAKKPAKRAPRAEVDSRIELIAGKFLRGEWVAGDSHRELASQWRVSVSAVEKYAATASRVAVERLGGVDQVRAWGLSFIQRNAMAAAAEGNHKTAIDGAVAFLKIVGADAPQKVAVTNVQGEDLPEYMRRAWPLEVLQWAIAQGRVVGEAEMAAKADEFASAGASAGTG